MGARLCYSASSIDEIAKGVAEKDQSAFIDKVVSMGHLSTVEHAVFTFGIEGVSRSLLAQITRHRIASFSVQSQRYVGIKMPEGQTFGYIIPPAIKALGKEAEEDFSKQMQIIQGWYNEWADKLGGQGESVFEDARFVLPNAAETKILCTMNARELRHFFALRCCNRAQWEIRELAWRMLALAKEAAPHIFANAGPACISSICPEGKRSCGKAAEVIKRYDQLGK